MVPSLFALRALGKVAYMACFKISLSALFVGFVMAAAAAASDMTPGDLLIYRVGDGLSGLASTGDPVFLDEYTPSGTLVQSFNVPTAPSGANYALFASGKATSEGMLTLSADGQFVTFTGYASLSSGAASLASSSAADINRVVGIVDAHGNIDTSTALSDFSDGNNPRSAVTTNGTDIWVSGAGGGVRYTTRGATTSLQLNSSISNSTQVNIFGGQLYFASNKNPARGLNSMGTGLPTTSGQTFSNLVLATTADTFDSFYLADLNNSPGPDTMYVCDESAGILKYSLFDGTWWPEGGVGLATDVYRGLTGEVQNGNVTLFAVRNGGGGASGGGSLVSVTDTSGFGNIMNGNVADLADAAPDTAFRGVSLVPVATTPEPSTLALLAAAAFGLLGYGWRRRAARAAVATENVAASVLPFASHQAEATRRAA